MDWHRPWLSASFPQAPCPSRRDSPPHGEFLLICFCNQLGVRNEPGRVISKRRLVLTSPAGLCRCRCRGRGGNVGRLGRSPHADPPLLPAGGRRVGRRGQVRGQWGLFSQQCLSPHATPPPPAPIKPSPGTQPPPQQRYLPLKSAGNFRRVCSPQPAPRYARRGRTAVWKGGGWGEPCTPQALFFSHLLLLQHGDGAAPCTQPGSAPGHAATSSYGLCGIACASTHTHTPPAPKPAGCISRPPASIRQARSRAGTAFPCPAQPTRGLR